MGLCIIWLVAIWNYGWFVVSAMIPTVILLVATAVTLLTASQRHTAHVVGQDLRSQGFSVEKVDAYNGNATVLGPDRCLIKLRYHDTDQGYRLIIAKHIITPSTVTCQS